MATLLLTRPKLASERFARAFPEVETIISPVLDIVATDHPAPGPFSALILTSSHALEHYAGPTDLPAFIVGDATAKRASKRGLRVEMCAPTASALLAQMTGHLPQPLCHVRGSHAAVPIAESLTARGIHCLEWQVYAQIAQDLSTQAVGCLQGRTPVVLPLFSPRSCALAFDQIAAISATAPLIVVAMSQAIADVVRNHKAGAQNLVGLHIARAPDAESMVNTTRNALAQAHALEASGDRP